MSQALKGWVSGRVQGVGFRYFVQRCAEAQGLQGYAVNLDDGRVEVLLQGPGSRVERVKCQVEQGPQLSNVDEVVWTEVEQSECNGFRMG